MKSKRIIGGFALLAAFIVSSCSTSNDVVSNRKIQKRKYTKGFHVSDKNMSASLKGNKEEKTVVFKAEEDNNKVENITASIESVNNKNTIVEENTNAIPVVVVSEITEEANVASENIELTNDGDLTEKEEALTFVSKKDVKTKTKISKKENNSNSSDGMLILLVILAFIIPFVAVGIKTDWDLMKVLICLLLSILLWLPGVIYALLIVLDVI
jgi:uncharacterized membrane protein YqaE (UPF0057 family)